MTHSAPLPDRLARLDALARRIETPCGDGQMVWRQWNASAVPVLLVHGGSGSWTHWARNIQALLDAGHGVLAPDLPGFGKSASPPGGEDADAIVAPFVEGLRAVATGPLDVVAFSFGSLVATLATAHAPETVKRLVLVGGPLLPLPSGRGVALESWRHLASESEQAAVHARNLRALMLHSEESIDAEAVTLHARNVARDRMRKRRQSTTRLMADTLAGLRCPADTVYGAQDVLYRDHWPELRSLTETLPAVRDTVLIPRAGHWVQFEEACAFNSRLLGLLAG